MWAQVLSPKMDILNIVLLPGKFGRGIENLIINLFKWSRKISKPTLTLKSITFTGGRVIIAMDN